MSKTAGFIDIAGHDFGRVFSYIYKFRTHRALGPLRFGGPKLVNRRVPVWVILPPNQKRLALFESRQPRPPANQLGNKALALRLEAEAPMPDYGTVLLAR